SMAAFLPLFICGLCTLLLLAALCVSKSLKQSSLNLPPGPFPLPVIVVLFLSPQISEKYGPVFTIHLGFQRTVVLTGYEAVKEALLNTADVFADRPAIPIFYHIQHGNELWKTTRRFTMATMRDLGMGKRLAEERIQEEFGDEASGEPFRLRFLNTAPTNITFAILFGRRFDYKDPTFVTLLRLIDEVMLLLGSPFLHVSCPLLKCFSILSDLVGQADFHCWTIFENLEVLPFPLVSQKEKDKSNTSFYDANVLASALDLLMAGTETTSTTLQWAILLMMKYPEIQRKVHAEIEQVLGPSCLPTFEDRKNMPFTNAVIHEVQRFVTLLPHVPRCTSTDTYFKGYFIPKGTTVIPLLTSVLLDKTQWETPEEFNPNHFLDVDGNFVKKKAFLPFSTGRRNCVGESLATVELFIFFTGLMQKFTFKPQPGVKESELDTTAEAGFTMRPHPQCACAVPRE
uniref:Cytochrome P450 2W1-like n=1 Tax=Nothoprocta perdicaria TaxID=30464 RepID=A0A8C6YQX0_NOTPE